MDKLRPKNHIVLVGGHAGSGKTEVSKIISKAKGWAILDKDTLTHTLVEALAERICGDADDRQSEKYVEIIRPLEYSTLLEVMWEVVESGVRGVVVTAPFNKELRDPGLIREIAQQGEDCGYEVSTIWVQCDDEVRLERIIRRGRERDRWKIENWETWVTTLLPYPETVQEVMNNNGSYAQLYQDVLGVMERLDL